MKYKLNIPINGPLFKYNRRNCFLLGFSSKKQIAAGLTRALCCKSGWEVLGVHSARHRFPPEQCPLLIVTTHCDAWAPDHV